MQATTDLPFRFRYVKDGQARGLWPKTASASSDALVLDGEPIQYEDIVDTTSYDKRLVLAMASTVQLGQKTAKACQEGGVLALEVKGVEARDLERTIDRRASALAAQRHKRELAAAFEGSRYRVMTCPHCEATIDLSNLEPTRYVYCRYCKSILEQGGSILSVGDIYRVCTECQMFGRVRGYTVFYFYFLLIVYGYSLRRRHLCDTCAVRTAQRALLLNFIFLLGIPPSIYMWVRALSGHEPEMKDLHKANALARKGKAEEAEAIYGRLQQRLGDYPGLLLNQGIGYLQAGDGRQGIEYLNRALRACSNYQPAMQRLLRLQRVAEESRASSVLT
jgi:tetratricopeptide (TPR) repeat protein